MKFLASLTLVLLISGCAVRKDRPHETSPVLPTATAKEVKKAEAASLNKGVLWDLLSQEQMTLQFKNVDNGTNLSVVIEHGTSIHPVSTGHWELTGFEIYGKSFYSMNTSKKFVMRVKSKSLVYAGTIVVGCPKVESSNLKLLKSMRFFNRYPFSGSIGLCEMVIGNDLARVRTELKNTRKSKKLNITMGF